MTMRRVRAFTLIELLVVVAIIAILAAIVMPGAMRLSEQAGVAQVEAQVQRIMVAQKTYKMEHGIYLVHWTSGTNRIDGNRSKNCYYNKEGRLVTSSGTVTRDSTSGGLTMVDVLNNYGAGIDYSLVNSSTGILGDHWETPLVAGIIELADKNASWEGWSCDEWLVRGYKAGDYVVFSEGLSDRITGARSKERRIYDATNDTGCETDQLEDTVGDKHPYRQLKSDAKPKYEQGVRRWNLGK